MHDAWVFGTMFMPNAQRRLIVLRLDKSIASACAFTRHCNIMACNSIASLLFLSEIDRLSLQHMEQRLRRLEDFHVCSFSLLYRFVVLVAGLCLADEALVDFLQTVGQT